MKNKLKNIPDSVLKAAEFIKECDKNGQQMAIVQKRRCGMTLAFNLARQTQDTEYELVTPKQLTDGTD